MPFRVSGKNIDVGEALRTKINTRIAVSNGCRFYCRQFNRKTPIIVNGAWAGDG